jgi:hypothetical protein
MDYLGKGEMLPNRDVKKCVKDREIPFFVCHNVGLGGRFMTVINTSPPFFLYLPY